jgi:hypothetical protein
MALAGGTQRISTRTTGVVGIAILSSRVLGLIRGPTVAMESDTTAAGTRSNDYSETKTWHAVDACGNTSAPVSQTVTVQDTTPPAIGGKGSNATIECRGTPSFTAPTVSLRLQRCRQPQRLRLDKPTEHGAGHG